MCPLLTQLKTQVVPAKIEDATSLCKDVRWQNKDAMLTPSHI